MLAEIAAFNLACATVKEAANHAGDIANVFRGIGEMISAREKVTEAVKDSKAAGKSDLELYAAHVEMEQAWEEVKELLKWTGHWDSYIKFCNDRREEERQAKIAETRKELARKKAIHDRLIVIAIVLGVFTAVGLAIAMLHWFISVRGR